MLPLTTLNPLRRRSSTNATTANTSHIHRGHYPRSENAHMRTRADAQLRADLHGGGGGGEETGEVTRGRGRRRRGEGRRRGIRRKIRARAGASCCSAQHQGDHNAPQGSSIDEPSAWPKFNDFPGSKRVYAYP